jgi:glycine betaine/proline transport system permease protein
MAVAVSADNERPVVSEWRIAWAAMFAGTAAIYLLGDHIAWANVYPAAWELPLADWIKSAVTWLVSEISVVTRAVSRVLKVPFDIVDGLLVRGFKFGQGNNAVEIPPFSWIGVTAAAAIAGYAFGGRRLAMISGLGFLYLALFGQWTSAMKTLASISICVPLGVLIGLLIGIAGYRNPRFNKIVVVPLLDLAQAAPQYAYLLPMLLLFGINAVSGIIATLAFAVPPMVRVTTLALAQVPGEIRDFGHMAGCTRRQHLWRILVPSARSTLMLGVNQVIMMSLNMVIIASMIGADGLGKDVLLALRALKVGIALEAGIAIVVLAVVLDRLSQAIAAQKPEMYISGMSFHQRHPYLVLSLVLLIGTTAVGVFLPSVDHLPKSLTITTAPVWDGLIRWINVNFFDYIEAVRVAFLKAVLNPIRDFLLALPWIAVVAIVGLAGLQLGGRRLSLLVMSLAFFCTISSLWPESMRVVYLVGVSAVIACLIGIPLGVLSARNDTADRILTVIVDTLQTIPAFVYLIPAVMLLRVGDVAAMVGIILYAVAPAIRYTNHGIRHVPHALIEAAKVSGCTRRQLLWRVQMPLALHEILLGINQVVFLALSMDIIAAMVGTSDLGQEVFKALSKADPGRGIVAGLAVACIGIIADRLISAGSRRVKERFGLD